MDGRAAMERNREALTRIVAVLFALADLAERASALPRPILCLVLWVLRPAEAIVRDFVIDLSDDLGVPVNLPASCLESFAPMIGGGDRDDAVRLAVSLRMLAALLDTLAAQGLACRRTHIDLTGLLSALNPCFAPALPRSLAKPLWRDNRVAGYACHDTS